MLELLNGIFLKQQALGHDNYSMRSVLSHPSVNLNNLNNQKLMMLRLNFLISVTQQCEWVIWQLPGGRLPNEMTSQLQVNQRQDKHFQYHESFKTTLDPKTPSMTKVFKNLSGEFATYTYTHTNIIQLSFTKCYQLWIIIQYKHLAMDNQ